MKKLPYLLFLFLLMFAVGCGTGTALSTSAEGPVKAEDDPAVSGFSEDEGEGSSQNLSPLPSIVAADSAGTGEPIPSGAEDPFAAAVFNLAAELPASRETVNVEQHIFGQLTEEKARQLANQFGFTGPLYIQKIPPEFAPPEGEESPPVYTAFDGQRILNLSNTGLNFEDRGMVIDYNRQLTFEEKAPIVEAQLKAWNLLDFPYQLHKLPTGELAIYRLIDGIPTQQNEFNITLDQAGRVGYFDYHPLRLVDFLGSYPLQPAEMAWQQLQTAEGRAQVRYQLASPAGSTPLPEFVSARSWAPLSEHGQERHLYMTPIVFETTDGSGLRLLYGDMTLTGDSTELADIAAHLGDVLHLWGTIDRTGGAKNFSLEGWELLDGIEYQTLEGIIFNEAGQTLLRTMNDEVFILAAAPADIPEGLEVYVSAAGQRDTGAAYPVLDWDTITEKVVYPDTPLEMPGQEPAVIDEIRITSVELVHFTLYRAPNDAQADSSLLFVPVWRFDGETNNGQLVTFWVPAVSQQYTQTPLPSGSSGSIFGWVWHDLCATAKDGEPALTSAPAGCIEDASPLGDYRADGNKDSQEPVIAGLVVRLGVGTCPATDLAETITTASDISYSFSGLEAGTYCVSINPSEEPNLSLLRPGIWTFPEVSEGTIEKTVTLPRGENVFDINFGWDHQFLP